MLTIKTYQLHFHFHFKHCQINLFFQKKNFHFLQSYFETVNRNTKNRFYVNVKKYIRKTENVNFVSNYGKYSIFSSIYSFTDYFLL